MSIPKGRYKNTRHHADFKFFDEPSTSSQDIACNRNTSTSSNMDYPNKRYLFTNKITDGSASIIYKGIDKETNKTVVIKSISKKEPWRKELEILKSLSKTSERIVKYLDFYESNRRSYIVTEYHTGLDLFEHIDLNIPYKEKHGMHILLEMAKCIRECHELGIAHLDIKCENFMVNGKYIFDKYGANVVLIDFGHSEKMENHEKLAHGYNYGTTYYVCPEGYENMYSSKSDIWSLGICMAYILTGDFPFKGNEKEYIKNTKKGTVTLARPLSREMELLIKRCLQIEPNKRPNIGQVIAFLEFAIGNST
jgi:serine/threonine protein kinase